MFVPGGLLREANILVSEASKLSAGARIFSWSGGGGNDDVDEEMDVSM